MRKHLLDPCWRLSRPVNNVFESRGHMLGISRACLGHIMGLSWVYLGHIFGISWAYLEHISGISWAHLGHILTASWAELLFYEILHLTRWHFPILLLYKEGWGGGV